MLPAPYTPYNHHFRSLRTYRSQDQSSEGRGHECLYQAVRIVAGIEVLSSGGQLGEVFLDSTGGSMCMMSIMIA